MLDNQLTPEQKTRIKDRIHRFLHIEKPAEIFGRAFLWVVQANGLLQMFEMTGEGASGSFEAVANHLEKKSKEDEQEFEDENQ